MLARHQEADKAARLAELTSRVDTSRAQDLGSIRQLDGLCFRGMVP